MMEEGNVTILVDAKQEYTKQLINILKNSVYDTIQSIYKDAHKECKEKKEKKKTLLTFQKKLSDIPKWSPERIEKEYNIIAENTKCDWIDDLLTAVFITHTKILTIVHKGQQSKKVNLKIPKASHFIHLCYIETAREFWKNPYLFSEKVSQYDYQRNMRDALTIISDTITETIRKQLPVKHILKEYLGDNYQSEAEEEDDKTENITQPTSKKHVKDIKKMVTKQINETSSNLNIENDNDLKNLIKEEVSKQISGEEVKEGLIVEETVPVVEEVKEVAPEVEEVKEVTPEVEEVKEVKEDKEEVSPIVEEVKEDKEEVAPVVEEDKDDKDEVAPVVEEVKEDKEKVVPVIEEEVKEDKEEVVPVVEEEVEEDNELKELDLKKKPEEIVNSDDIKTLLLDNDINYDENIENEDSEEEDNSDDENDDSDEDSEDSNSYDSELDESDINDSDLEDSDYDEEENNNDKLEIEDIGDLDIELDDLDLNLDDNEVDLNELSETKQNEQVLNNKEAFSFYDE